MNIEYYRSAEDLPIRRFHRFNKYLMKSTDIGSDFQDFAHRIHTAIKFINTDNKAKAIVELSNMEICVFNALNELSPMDLAHAVMIKSIDDVPMTDMSEEGLKEIAEKVGDHITRLERDDKVAEIKKK